MGFGRTCADHKEKSDGDSKERDRDEGGENDRNGDSECFGDVVRVLDNDGDQQTPQ